VPRLRIVRFPWRSKWMRAQLRRARYGYFRLHLLLLCAAVGLDEVAGCSFVRAPVFYRIVRAYRAGR